MEKPHKPLDNAALIAKASRVRYINRKNPIDYLVNCHKLTVRQAQDICAQLPSRQEFEEMNRLNDERRSGLQRLEKAEQAEPAVKSNAATPEKANKNGTFFSMPNTVTFNTVTGDYGVHLDKLGQTRFMKEDDHIQLMLRYTGAIKSKNNSTDRLVSDFKFNTRSELEEYAEKNLWSRSVPCYVTVHELQNKFDELQDIERRRRNDVDAANLERIRAESEWQVLTSDAKSWRDLSENHLRPLMQVMLNTTEENDRLLKEQWNRKYPRQALKNSSIVEHQDGECLVVTLSDIHFGAKASARRLVHGYDYNFAIIKDIMEGYTEFIKARIRLRRQPFKRIWLFLLGDLLHGLDGETVKGTRLEVEAKGMEQYLPAFSMLRTFMEELCNMVDEVKVVAVRGNHAGDMDLMLVHAVASSLIPEYPGFTLCTTELRDTQFVETHPNVLFALNHGAAADYKAKLPNPDISTKRNNHLNRTFMAKTQRIKYHIQGDLHHYVRRDIGDLEDILLPSTLLGDCYSDTLSFYSRAGQKVFVVGNNGIVEEWSYHVDEQITEKHAEKR